MSDELLNLPFLSNVGLVMTYKCQIACPHCIIEAGPNRTEEASLAEALPWIREIASYRGGHVKFLSLTGGEPFYNQDNLRRMVAFAESQGLLVTVTTNAYWASSQERAVKVLRGMPGIRVLAISTDVYHQLAVPFERVRNAIVAAKECGIPFIVNVCAENENDERYRRIIDDLHGITGDDTIERVVTFPFGGAAEGLGASKYQTLEEPPDYACRACSSPVIFPDGRVFACVGPVITLKSQHPLLLGSLRERSLNEILDDAEMNAIVHATRIWGPSRLISMAEGAGLGRYLPQRYVRDSICYACHALMSSPEIVAFLRQLADDPEFKRKVAYARVYYLKETNAAERIERLSRSPG